MKIVKTKNSLLAMVAALTLVAACDESATLTSQTGVTSENRQDYLFALASVGCVLNDQRQYGAVEFQADLTREQMLEITAYYLRRGQAERIPDTEAVRITTGPCKA